MNKQWYVGVKKHNWHCDVFSSQEKPTEHTHGNKYSFCFGGYRTKRKAIQVAMYQEYVIDTPYRSLTIEEAREVCRIDSR